VVCQPIGGYWCDFALVVRSIGGTLFKGWRCQFCCNRVIITCILEEQEELQPSCSNVGGRITVVPLAISAD
jgi:hypothetical protein